MINKKLYFFLAAVVFSAALSAQEVPTKKDIRKEKRAEADSNGAKADALQQKNDIYDKQVMENTQETKTVQSHSHRLNRRFHKRKLMHRLRRRR